MLGINRFLWSKIYPYYFRVMISTPHPVPPFGVHEANDMAVSVTSSSLSQPSEDPTKRPFASFYMQLSHTTSLIRIPGYLWEGHGASLPYLNLRTWIILPNINIEDLDPNYSRHLVPQIFQCSTNESEIHTLNGETKNNRNLINNKVMFSVSHPTRVTLIVHIYMN